jgi:DNA modification methylase
VQAASLLASVLADGTRIVSDYAAFLESKRRDWTGCGIPDATLPAELYPFQDRLTAWALRKGRACLWADTGLGKTRMQVAWASAIPGRVLILAPLCVGPQTIAEARRIGITVGEFGDGARIEITNYERLHHVDPRAYAGIVLDESSILKSMDGKTRTRLIEMFGSVPYRLCCTATPAPNDIAELANHCEFLGIMTRTEMLATFFVHDDNGWRLKGHATEAFYRWLASWGLFLRRPSDLGFSDEGYMLPPLDVRELVVGADDIAPHGEFLFPGMGLGGIRGRSAARQRSLKPRCDAAIALAETPGQWIVWCGMNAEQDAIADALDGDCVSVQGSDSEHDKSARLQAFIEGRARVLVTKPRIAGFGLNLQRCYQMAFVGLGDSYEQYYQAIRRCYRFGQTEPVRVHIIVSEAEREIVRNVRRKEAEAAAVATALIASMAEAEKEEIGVTTRERVTLKPEMRSGAAWTLYHGDAVDTLQQLPESSVDLSVYSPPFMALFTYTNSERDLGNCSTRAEFLEHMGYLIRGLWRVTKPGRLSACHIAQVATTKVTHGVIGIADLRGAMIEAFVANGWVYHGDICVDKDPQAQAIRTHSKALLFVQLKKDASWLRPAIADYVLVFRKPGDNAVPIVPDISNEDWIEWARPIWYGIRESDTLNIRAGRSEADGRHICALQLGLIERCVRLWSNPSETVLSPFAGIGSEGYEALRLGRRFVGIELKREYFETAVMNLTHMEQQVLSQTTFLPTSGGPGV